MQSQESKTVFAAEDTEATEKRRGENVYTSVFSVISVAEFHF
jgi:hypothetical protein